MTGSEEETENFPLEMYLYPDKEKTPNFRINFTAFDTPMSIKKDGADAREGGETLLTGAIQTTPCS